MTLVDYLNSFWEILKKDPNIGIGIVISTLAVIFLLSEIKIKIQHGTTSENLMLSLIGLTFGLVLIFWSNWLMAIALSLFVLAVYQTYQLRESPVWRELMITSTATYLVFLIGTILSQVTDNETYSGWAYNLMIYVFLIMALFFFGKKFVLVSRLMSPQILYLTLFALAYVVLFTVSNLLQGEQNLSIYYLPIDRSIAERVIFLSFAPYEMIIIISFALYFISGWLLTKLLGIKPVSDERILKLVDEVKTQLGIKRRVKVGFVKAPILNAMAYGPFFDLRVAFIARDLSEFSDDDIRGIVAHELAHNARHHIIWLQFIASAEMIIKKALLLPATTLDYAAYEQKVPFVVYFIINYGILAFLLIFVRVLEGDADLQTKKAGYGKALAQALYKLEGFYQGVAGDFGLNVQLLTGKEYTEEEKERFLSEAAITLYRHLYRPGRWAMFANIFMSHPRTAFRIIAMVEDDLSPVKTALLPYWLLLPDFIRGKTIKKLSKKRDMFSELIDERFKSYYGEEGIQEYLDLSKIEEFYMKYINRHVVAYDFVFDKVVEGKVLEVSAGNSICKPLLMRIQIEEGETSIDVADYSIHDAEIGTIYIRKDGTIAKLEQWKKNKKSNQPIFILKNLQNEKEITSNYTGKPQTYFDDFKDQLIFFFKDGLDRKAQLTGITWEKSLAETTFEFIVDEGNKQNTLKFLGKELIIELPPVLLRLHKDKKEIQNGLFDILKGKAAILYTKEEVEIGITCIIEEADKDKVIYRIRDKVNEIERKKIDFISAYCPVPKIILKEHISAGDKLLIKWTNLKEMRYIYT
ncbi:MAG: M48 family metalloprotease [Candidatus Heimdallarchaeaceae archaeon]